jgi:RHS repeat-associated protein
MILVSQPRSVDTIEYYYDLASNLLTQNRNDGQFTYEYDNLHRLTEEEADNYAKRYTYDAVGNRTRRVQESFKADGTTQTSTQKLTYETDSNKLKKRWSTAITHDENGNIISGISSHVFTYGPNNRMMSAKIGTEERARFYYNAYGERIRKLSSKSGTHVLFQYGSNGKLLTESFVNKKGHYYRINNYIWYGDTPVALVEQNLSSTGNVWAEYIKYIHTDHLNTPIYITQNDQTVIWKWVSDAFGQGSQITDPDGNGKRFYFRLRFPGQFYDWETGLNYNYFRDYAPAYGRYVQSDPIGLNAGLNTFGYVGGNPVNYVDPKGLICVPCAVIGIGIGALLNPMPANAPGECDVVEGYSGVDAAFDIASFIPPARAAKGPVKELLEEAVSKGTDKLNPKLIQEDPRNLIPTQTKSEMSGSQVKRLTKDMKQNGFDQSEPVDVWRNPNTGRLEIQDGHHRTEAAKKAGLDKIPVQVWE